MSPFRIACDDLSPIHRMNATHFYGPSRKRAELALPVDSSEDEIGFSDEENEEVLTQQGESESDEEDNEDSGESESDDEDNEDSGDREDSEGESAVTGITSKRV